MAPSWGPVCGQGPDVDGDALRDIGQEEQQEGARCPLKHNLVLQRPVLNSSVVCHCS